MDPDGPAERTARALGARLRRARLSQRMTQAEIQAQTGVSQATISRMELGRGEGFALRSWLVVADAVGLALASDPSADAPYAVADITRMAASGDWVRRSYGPAIATAGWVVVLERPARVVRSRFGRRSVSSERMVVSLVAILTDVTHVMDAAGDDLDDVSTGHLVIVRRSTENLRRLTELRAAGRGLPRESGTRWIAALRDAGAAMPKEQGLVWMDASAQRLIPVGLRLRNA